MSTTITEQDLIRKEQELEQAIRLYQSFDMRDLKDEVYHKLQQETAKIDKEARDRQREIQSKFEDITKLSADHIRHGDRYLPSAPEQLDEELTQRYNEQEQQF